MRWNWLSSRLQSEVHKNQGIEREIRIGFQDRKQTPCKLCCKASGQLEQHAPRQQADQVRVEAAEDLTQSRKSGGREVVGGGVVQHGSIRGATDAQRRIETRPLNRG